MFQHLCEASALEEAVRRLMPSGRPGRIPKGGRVPFTSRAKKVLEFAMREARDDDALQIGPEHLVLGLIREEKGIAAAALREFGIGCRQDWRSSVRRSGAFGGRFQIRVEDSSERTFYEQIIDQVREAVASGLLGPGDRLPSVRQLADLLELAPGTVARAYRDLEESGTVETNGARGTRVASPQPRSSLPAEERVDTLAGMLRPVAIAAFHLGANEQELSSALEEAVRGVFKRS
jgi:GntR family transcriptional regulator